MDRTTLTQLSRLAMSTAEDRYVPPGGETLLEVIVSLDEVRAAGLTLDDLPGITVIDGERRLTPGADMLAQTRQEIDEMEDSR